MPHQSDVAFLTFMMPHLNPASVAEYLEFGLYGFALSRFSGMWVGFKAVSETVESAMSVMLPPWPRFSTPEFQPPPGGLHYRWPDFPGPQIEERLEAKKAATLAFAAANPIDRKIFDVRDARYGIVTTGKAHLDLMEALRLLGIGRQEARRIGLDVYKVGMVWPLEHDGALEFVKNKHEVLVVEEKRGIIESQFKEYFYDYPGRKPQRMVGKADENGARLVPWTGELAPIQLAGIVARRLDAEFPGLGLTARADALHPQRNLIDISGATRIPYFCSGCPHNSSTKVPEGSQALAGIGCHFMANWMDRDTDGLIQMGGEGVNWVSRSLFNGRRHVFQNLGDGTFYHSGSVAIRQAVAAGTNITYKILFNDAVAMTGGQPVDGPVSVQSIAHSVRAEGVTRIALVSDEPERFDLADFPRGTTLSHRRDLDPLQRELREVPGVTVLIYAQTCATEKRRRRKRGLMDDPQRVVVINDLVCEGCGDCSVESNCLSVIPKETPFGRKRQIDQNNCNKDYSCLNGFCPSFVTVEGGVRKLPAPAAAMPDLTGIAAPMPGPIEDCHDLLVTGVGGTGVVTVGALITMAAHLEGKGASVLDFMGFAQKFGPVLSYIRLAEDPAAIHQVRIEQGRADALIGCDLVVSSSPQASRTYDSRHTRAVLNTAEMATGDFVRHRDANLKAGERVAAVGAAVASLTTLDANRLAAELLGDTIYANVLLLGAAFQAGLVPVTLGALERAIELNGVKVAENKRALAWGRIACADAERLPKLAAAGTAAEPLDAYIERRARFLVDYQDVRLAEPLPGTRRARAHGRRCTARRRCAHPLRSPGVFPAACLQGRVRSRAPARADRLRRRLAPQLRSECADPLSPGAAAVEQPARCTRPATQEVLRGVAAARLSRARRNAAAARRSLRRFRLFRRAAHGARADPRIRRNDRCPAARTRRYQRGGGGRRRRALSRDSWFRTGQGRRGSDRTTAGGGPAEGHATMRGCARLSSATNSKRSPSPGPAWRLQTARTGCACRCPSRSITSISGCCATAEAGSPSIRGSATRPARRTGEISSTRRSRVIR